MLKSRLHVHDDHVVPAEDEIRQNRLEHHVLRADAAGAAGVDRAHDEKLHAVDVFGELVGQIGNVRVQLIEAVLVVCTRALLGKLLHFGDRDNGIDLFLRQAQRQTDGGGGDGKGQGHADDHGDDDPHEEGLEFRGPHDGLSHGGGGLAHRGGNEGGEADTRQHRDNGRHQNIDLSLLTDGLTQLGGQNGDEQHRQRAAGSAHGVGGEAHGDQGEQHQRRGLQCPADGYRHAGAHHGGAQAADGVGHGPLALADGDDALRQEADVQLRPQSVEDGPHQQGAEETLRHSSHGVDEVALGGECDVLPGQKCFEFVHECPSLIGKLWCLDT